MPHFDQDSRIIQLFTPLSDNLLQARSIVGREGISQLFHYQVTAIAYNEEDAGIDFAKLMGQPLLVQHRVGEQANQFRYFHGLISRVSRIGRGTHVTTYSFDIVPSLWLWTRITRSRIFQQISVPDILKQVLQGLTITWEIQGTFEKRDYVVQYRESDFAFVSRLMEEEGIFYFFEHSDGGHKMIIGNTPQSHRDVPVKSAIEFEEDSSAGRSYERIQAWGKTQYLRSSKVTLWDHTFELPHKHLEATEPIQQNVAVGKTTHDFTKGNEGLELYDYPGEYAQRFDGISPSGGEQASELQKIFEDNRRTTKLRMQQEAVNALLCEGSSDFAGLIAGHKFELQRHFGDNGTYVITELDFHLSQASSYIGGDAGGRGDEDVQEMNFQCIPLALPFRPQRITPKPSIQGTQTAVVVGPPGEDIYTDKYGRIKVQFHWDQEGQYNASSSCWIRVVTSWAGKNWGNIFIPRIGMEAVIAFEEGDPDRPACVGVTYNADTMPPYVLPDQKTKSTIKSRSSLGGGGFNEFRFEDKKGEEQLFIHAERNMDLRVKADRMTYIGWDDHYIVYRDLIEKITRDHHTEVQQDRILQINRDLMVKVTGKTCAKLEGGAYVDVTGSLGMKASGNASLSAGSIYLNAKTIILDAQTQISLKVGGNFVDVGPGGVTIMGTMVKINSGGAAGSGSAVSMIAPGKPLPPNNADSANPGGLPNYSGGGGKGKPPVPPPPKPPTHNPKDPKNEEKKHWIGIELKDDFGQPMAGEEYEIKLPDGAIVAGTLDDHGKVKVDNVDPGTAIVRFPRLADWEES